MRFSRLIWQKFSHCMNVSWSSCFKQVHFLSHNLFKLLSDVQKWHIPKYVKAIIDYFLVFLSASIFHHFFLFRFTIGWTSIFQPIKYVLTFGLFTCWRYPNDYFCIKQPILLVRYVRPTFFSTNEIVGNIWSRDVLTNL